MVGQLSSLRARQMLSRLSKARLLAACGGAMLLCAAAPAGAQDDHLSLGTLVLAALTDVCVPVIERGESLPETASEVGFLEVTGEDRAALGGGEDMSLWMYEFPDTLLLVGRDLGDPGSACRIAASVPKAYEGDLAGDVGGWAAEATPAFELVAAPSSKKERDAQWMWERAAGGTLQRMRLSLTRHADGTVTSTLQYGILPPRR